MAGMAGVDPRAAVSQARTGVTPPGCERFALKSSTVWVNALLAPLLGLGMIAFAIGNVIYSLNTGEVWAPDILFAIVPSIEAVLIIETLVFLGAGVALLVFAARSLGPVRSRNDYFLLLTPDAVVEVAGAKVKSAAYSQIARATRASNGEVTFALRTGQKVTMTLGQYGSTSELYADILSRIPRQGR